MQSDLSPRHHHRHELVLLAGVEGGHLTSSVETVAVTVGQVRPAQQAETNIAVSVPARVFRVTLLQTFSSGGGG